MRNVRHKSTLTKENCSKVSHLKISDKILCNFLTAYIFETRMDLYKFVAWHLHLLKYCIMRNLCLFSKKIKIHPFLISGLLLCICQKLKSGLIIGFYLRTLRICFPEYLNIEKKYIEKKFFTTHIISLSMTGNKHTKFICLKQ